MTNAANENVLEHLKVQLETCESFVISVAFVTEAGLAALKSHFIDLKAKGIRGRLITSDYLGFNNPKVFSELLKIKNLDVRIFPEEGFHAKGYVFKQKDYYSITIGSSNLTLNALQKNYEWNIQLTSLENGDIVNQVLAAVDDQWQKSFELTSEWIKNYTTVFETIIQAKRVQQKNSDTIEITPNTMQKEALTCLADLRSTGARRGLIISATGTGKTFLSAFDVKAYNPERMLFIVHREQILQKAMTDFKKILGGKNDDYTLLTSKTYNRASKYVFATIQSLAKEERLNSFNKKAFNYILIDESHKVGGHSYQRVVDYFTPDFLLGMTATPERTDAFNIFELFDYNVAYEIRLQGAMEAEMLCPFQYFGVTDYERNGETIDDHTNLDKLVSKERVSHLIEKVEYYGYSGKTLRGLIFCSRKEEANELAVELCHRGYETVALTGSNSIAEREAAVDQLEQGTIKYIVTVDIFNEGIDIPSVNQVVMLRQTQSSIIFVQQLGRGLRKSNDKEYVTIIDFIGNYKNNYLIPIALTGDTSKNKDNIRHKMSQLNYMSGLSTINFEEIAKQRIFSSINQVKLNSMVALKEAYFGLKQRLGYQPKLTDFIMNDSIDPEVIIKAKKTYPAFLNAIKEDTSSLSDYQLKVIQFISIELLNGKRRHELLILNSLLQRPVAKHSILDEMRKLGLITTAATIKSVENVLNLTFFVESHRKAYGEAPIVILENRNYRLNSQIEKSIENDEFKQAMQDVITAGFLKSKQYDIDKFLTIGRKYSRKDACRILNWEKDESSTVYGYKTKFDTCPIFFTYHKSADIDASIAYEDEFLSQKVIKWYTRSPRTLSSEEVITITSSNRTALTLHVFVKKSDGEGADSYYLGTATVNETSAREVIRNGKPIVEMQLILDNEIDHGLYHYISGEV